MKWTTGADIKAELKRRWKRGEMCRAVVGEPDYFPLSLSFKIPSAKIMLNEFATLQDWVKLITHFARQHGLQLQWREVNHRSLGRQQLPAALLLESPQQAASLIGKRQALKLFGYLYSNTLRRCPELQPWLCKRPLKLLELEQVWLRLVDLCLWMQAHPNPRIYLRQVDVAGVDSRLIDSKPIDSRLIDSKPIDSRMIDSKPIDSRMIDSKLIESHRGVLAELFDLVLPRFAVNDDFSGVSGFARRYGFLDKPQMLRVRPLDAAIRLLETDATALSAQDVVMTAPAFAGLNQAVQAQTNRVFIVENEINYLAFPELPGALVIFGSGYGFEALKQADWIKSCTIYYWGDLDTHGFAILNQLRATFPQVQSFLMDRQTLLHHQSAWVVEPKQETKDLLRLTQEEASLYHDLRSNRLANQLRLEQERIDFMYAKKHILATDTHRYTQI